jgi:hypothetical protein
VRGPLPMHKDQNIMVLNILIYNSCMPVHEGIRQELFMVVPHASSRYD